MNKRTGIGKGTPGPGRPVGSKNERTKQWEALGESIATTHTERFNAILDAANDDKFVYLYLQTLEYFKPKLGRTEHTGKDGVALPAPQIIMGGNGSPD